MTAEPTIELPLTVAAALANAIDRLHHLLPVDERPEASHVVAVIDAKKRFALARDHDEAMSVDGTDNGDAARAGGEFHVMSVSEIATAIGRTPRHVTRLCSTVLEPLGLARRLGREWAISPSAMEVLER